MGAVPYLLSSLTRILDLAAGKALLFKFHSVHYLSLWKMAQEMVFRILTQGTLLGGKMLTFLVNNSTWLTWPLSFSY